MAKENAGHFRILSLDGGGIRGIITAVWLDRLERTLEGPVREHFDLIAGTSTGGLISDPTVNIFVPGPDPRDPANVVLHAYENCDAVERTSYEIDGIRVSNFVTPHYFTFGDEPGTRNDFLGVGVTSFGVTRDSHIAFFDLSTNTWEVVYGRKDPKFMRHAARAKLFDHPKPERPSDEILNGILDKYNEKPHAKCRGLKHVRGITRTARYQATALGMRR